MNIYIKWIDSLFTCENLINKQSLLNQGKLSSLVSLEYGIPKFMLMRCMLNKEMILKNRKMKLFI